MTVNFKNSITPGKITADMIPNADEQALYLEARENC